MRPFVVKPLSRIKGEISLPGDKSIAHRSIIISAISVGVTTIENFPANEDCLWTLKAFKKLGIKITKFSSTVTVKGRGLLGLVKPKGRIFVGDSGTTLRLLLGVLAGQSFKTELVAGSSLSKRPMRRVTEPLRMMGARINARIKIPRHKDLRHKYWRIRQFLWRRRVRQEFWRKNAKLEEYPPITIIGGNLKPITYDMPIASAQVKSAIILAALYVRGKTCVREHIRTRDHTERMLKLFRAGLKLKHPPSPKASEDVRRSFSEGGQNTIVIKGNRELVSPGILKIPGDISSAAFFIVLATIIPDSLLYIKNVSLNPLRIGIVKVLRRMGADIKIKKSLPDGRQGKSPPQRFAPQILAHLPILVAEAPIILAEKFKNGEPAGDILIKSSKLTGTIVRKDEVPSLIDELPILMVAASIAKGRTVFEGVGELRVKETDRIRAMYENLRRMGANITVFSATKSATTHGGLAGSCGERGGSAKYFGGKASTTENIIIQGVKQLKAASAKSFGDHRIAMSMVIAGLAATGRTRLDDISCINKSFPDFLSLLGTLTR